VQFATLLSVGARLVLEVLDEGVASGDGGLQLLNFLLQW